MHAVCALHYAVYALRSHSVERENPKLGPLLVNFEAHEFATVRHKLARASQSLQMLSQNNLHFRTVMIAQRIFIECLILRGLICKRQQGRPISEQKERNLDLIKSIANSVTEQFKLTIKKACLS